MAQVIPRTGEEWRDRLLQLLPRGPAFEVSLDSVVAKLLRAFGEELARIDARFADLAREWNPRTTSELLEEWEDYLGLPDPSLGPDPTFALRRFFVVAKLTGLKASTIAAFVELAEVLGYSIEVVEESEFLVGISGMGDALGGVEWAYTITIHAPKATWSLARAGEARAGEPLQTHGNGPLEALLLSVKPAHARVLFAYDLEATGYAPWSSIELDGPTLGLSAGGFTVYVSP